MPAKSPLPKYILLVVVLAVGSYFFFGGDDDLPTDEGSTVSSSSASSESSGSGSSSPLAVIDHGPTLPFDGCAKLSTYVTAPWYETLKQEFAEQYLDFTDERIHLACTSSQYVIFLYADVSNTSSTPYRYVVATSSLEKATVPTGTGTVIKANTFAKREGDTVPLIATISGQECESELYDVRDNSVSISEYLCRDALPECVNASVTDASGRALQPTLSQYAHLRFLGQIFTAADCGPTRLKNLFKGIDTSYTAGSTIWLTATEPSAELRAVLESIGFACTDTCQTWRRSDPVTIRNLLRLRPYVGEMKQDDCVHCG